MTVFHNPGLILSELTIESVPQRPAVYAILSDGQAGSTNKRCRYIGVTENLRDSILKHFQTSEPIIPLRYFMLSSKVKYLQYEIAPTADRNFLFNRADEWMEEFNMSSPSEEKEETAQMAYA